MLAAEVVTSADDHFGALLAAGSSVFVGLLAFAAVVWQNRKTRKENTEQHLDGRANIDAKFAGVSDSLVRLHEKHDQLDEKVDRLDERVDRLEEPPPFPG